MTWCSGEYRGRRGLAPAADPVDPDTLELARRGHGPAEIEASLLGLQGGGLSAEALDEDPFGPERVRPTLGRVARLVAEALACLPAAPEDGQRDGSG